ncbi:uncharacterized protein MYCGRDRAFT_88603 [Zymoseptoria tritici IPO323]|uniref:Uncharacterized protein n=1 Tax=Zymoseptoria tritici (strain CBS 115943 / IPO323) TaxID=336722 RepID=F9WXD1_ZYMTI|nr:uncharacterized protein MYCGRDRAFT_88603 [Zymoseptoria tritici IPO323]EGP92776.1 hypothetical protein MYCGRDRAFT_88603 [Zymoseptoria tritici IPO323]
MSHVFIRRASTTLRLPETVLIVWTSNTASDTSMADVRLHTSKIHGLWKQTFTLHHLTFTFTPPRYCRDDGETLQGPWVMFAAQPCGLALHWPGVKGIPSSPVWDEPRNGTSAESPFVSLFDEAFERAESPFVNLLEEAAEGIEFPSVDPSKATGMAFIHVQELQGAK